MIRHVGEAHFTTWIYLHHLCVRYSGNSSVSCFILIEVVVMSGWNQFSSRQTICSWHYVFYDGYVINTQNNKKIEILIESNLSSSIDEIDLINDIKIIWNLILDMLHIKQCITNYIFLHSPSVISNISLTLNNLIHQKINKLHPTLTCFIL